MYLLLRNYINSLGPIDSLARVTIITRLLDHHCQASTIQQDPFISHWSELKVWPEQPGGLVRVSLLRRVTICEQDRWCGVWVSDHLSLYLQWCSVLSLVLAVCSVFSAGLGWIFIRRELTDNFNGRWHQPTSGSSECVPIIPGLVSTSIIGINSNEPFLSTHQHSLSLVPIFNVMFQLLTVR